MEIKTETKNKRLEMETETKYLETKTELHRKQK